MKITFRRRPHRTALLSTALLSTALLPAQSSPPVAHPGASSRAIAGDPVHATSLPAIAAPFNPRPLSGRCGDPAGTWLELRWTAPVRWRLNRATAPEYLASGYLVSEVARAAAAAVATGRNDCGLRADLSTEQRYLGDTQRRANIAADGTCGERDRHNVVSFGRLAPRLLAVTCVWWQARPGDDHTLEADILIDASPGTFFLTPPQNCGVQWDLEGILTHEFGHLLGLGHVPYQQHPTLTMSEALAECTTGYRRLGLGDHLVLRSHYPPR